MTFSCLTYSQITTVALAKADAKHSPVITPKAFSNAADPEYSWITFDLVGKYELASSAFFKLLKRPLRRATLLDYSWNSFDVDDNNHHRIHGDKRALPFFISRIILRWKLIRPWVACRTMFLLHIMEIFYLHFDVSWNFIFISLPWWSQFGGLKGSLGVLSSRSQDGRR